MVVFRFVDDAFHVSGSGNSSEKSQKAYEARLISFGIFIGVAILFWAPLVIWKMIGRRRMSDLVKRWAEADVLARGPGAFVPMWWVQTPGIFDSRTASVSFISDVIKLFILISGFECDNTAAATTTY